MSTSISRRSSISPPPLKRRRVDKQSSITKPSIPRSKTLESSHTRIVSWNINGINPFVQPYLQKTLDIFVSPRVNAASKGQRRPETSGSDHDTDLRKEGKASLRETLKRQGWPQILLLQEVKIKPGDLQTLSAVRTAVSDSSEKSPPIPRDSTIHDSTDTDHPSTDENAKRNLADSGPRYDVHFVLPSDPHNAKGFGGKVYGVAAIIREDFMHQSVECVREPSWDREGRVQIIEARDVVAVGGFATSKKRSLTPYGVSRSDNNAPSARLEPQKIAIIHVYAINGTFNSYKSTHTGEVVGTRHDRKLAFHTELLKEALCLEERGFQVVIAGDLNIARDRIDGYPNLRTSPHQHVLNREDFNRKFFSRGKLPQDLAGTKQAFYDQAVSLDAENDQEGPESRVHTELRGLEAIDTFRHIHGTERRYSWHSRTKPFGTCCDRVDLILTSKSLGPYILDAGICDNPRDRGPSDHCPIWVDVGM